MLRTLSRRWRRAFDMVGSAWPDQIVRYRPHLGYLWTHMSFPLMILPFPHTPLPPGVLPWACLRESHIFVLKSRKPTYSASVLGYWPYLGHAWTHITFLWEILSFSGPVPPPYALLWTRLRYCAPSCLCIPGYLPFCPNPGFYGPNCVSHMCACSYIDRAERCISYTCGWNM